MKILILFSLSFLVLLETSCLQPKVTVRLVGFTNDTLAVAYVAVEDYPDVQSDADLRIVYDTVVATGGEAVFFPARQSYYLITPLETPMSSVNVIIDPTDCLHIDIWREGADFSYTAEGSAMAEGIADHARFVREVKRQIDSTYFCLERNPSNEVLSRLYDSLHDRRRELSAEWVAAHLDSPAAILVMPTLNPETQLEYDPLLNEKVRCSSAAVYMEPSRKRAEAYVASRSAREKVKEGEEAPGFTLPDSTGRQVSLSQLRGKWVVLDFWGTWCGWCVHGIPKMKKYEEQYRRECTFVSIDCNEGRKTWLAGLAEHRMPWLQLYNDPKAEFLSQVNVLYGVRAYPTKFILRPDGRIHKIVEGESPAFYEELERLFDKP